MKPALATRHGRRADADDHPDRDRRSTSRSPMPAIDDEPDALDSFTERRLVVPASDTKGRSERIYLRVPPLMIRASQMLVASKRYPWKTPGDFHRFAIMDAYRRLQRDAPAEVVSVIGQIEAMKGLLQHEEMHAEFLGIFERMSRVLEAYRNSNAHGEARRVVAELRAQINAMPAGYWREEYRKKLKERYGNLMSGDNEGNFVALGDGIERTSKQTVRERNVAGEQTPDAGDDEDETRPPHLDDDDDGNVTDAEHDID